MAQVLDDVQHQDDVIRFGCYLGLLEESGNDPDAISLLRIAGILGVCVDSDAVPAPILEKRQKLTGPATDFQHVSPSGKELPEDRFDVFVIPELKSLLLIPLTTISFPFARVSHMFELTRVGGRGFRR
jgi:hypothetical protein